MNWKTQYTDDFEALEDATQALEFLKIQVDFEGGRIVDHTRVSGCNYMVQVIFPDYGELDMIGCKRVLCPDSFLRLLGDNSH